MLDTVFQKPFYDATKMRNLFVLRFLSSRHNESQIVFQVLLNGRAQAWLYAVTGESIGQSTSRYLRTHPVLNALDIAKTVHIVQHELPLTPQVADAWRAGFSESVKASMDQLTADLKELEQTGEVTIFLDGTTYQLTVSEGVTDLRWSMMDAEVDDQQVTGRSPVAKWMNTIRAYALGNVPPAVETQRQLR